MEASGAQMRPAPGARTWKPPTVAAALIGGLVVATVTLSLLVWIGRGMASMPVSFGSTPVGVLGLVLSPICYAAVGGTLAARLPANPIGWLLLLIGVALGGMLPVNLLVAVAHESLRPASSFVVWIAWARTTFGTPVVLATVVVVLQIFPDGRPLVGRWRLGFWAAIAAGVLMMGTTAVDPIGLITYPSIANPLALPYALHDVVGGLRTVGVLAVIATAGVALAALWHRYRRGDAICRAQLRWIILAAAIGVAGATPFVFARYVLRVTDTTGELLSAIAQIGSCAFPLAAAFAISRYRLFDVDVVIGRTLVYLPLMAILGGMYTSAIALFQRIFVAVTGSESDAAIVLTILVVGSVFTPLRGSLERAVDRRFSGVKLDAESSEPHSSLQHGSTGGGALPLDQVALNRRVDRVHVGAISSDGNVECPLRSNVRVQDCLRCPYLQAFGDGPYRTVVCHPPQIVG